MEHTIQLIDLEYRIWTYTDVLAWSQYQTLLDDGRVCYTVRLSRVGGNSVYGNFLDLKVLV